MNSIRAQRYNTSESALPVEVELERRPPGRRHPASSTRPAGRRRGDRTPVLALFLASSSAVLALVSIATDDVATTPQARVAETIVDPAEPRDADVLAVPDGVPCPRQPTRGMVPC